MPLYCVVLKGADGSIAEERVIECVDDDEAIERAGDSEHPNEIEIWANTRLVARFPAMEAGSDYDRE